MPSTHKKDKPWDNDETLDKWKEDPFTPAEASGTFTEESSFVLLNSLSPLIHNLIHGLGNPFSQVQRNLPQGSMALNHPIARSPPGTFQRPLPVDIEHQYRLTCEKIACTLDLIEGSMYVLLTLFLLDRPLRLDFMT